MNGVLFVLTVVAVVAAPFLMLAWIVKRDERKARQLTPEQMREAFRRYTQ